MYRMGLPCYGKFMSAYYYCDTKLHLQVCLLSSLTAFYLSEFSSECVLTMQVHGVCVRKFMFILLF